MNGWAKLDFFSEWKGTEMRTSGRIDNWNFPDSVRTICHAQLRKPCLRVRIQFASLLVLIHLAEYPNELSTKILAVDLTPAFLARRWGDAVSLLGLINQSSSFEIALTQAFSIKNDSCCTCQRQLWGNWCEVYISPRSSRLGSLKLQQV